jgi:hypothetical protein
VGCQLVRGHGETGSEPCTQREAAGGEIEKAGMECRPHGGEGAGGGYLDRT